MPRRSARAEGRGPLALGLCGLLALTAGDASGAGTPARGLDLPARPFAAPPLARTSAQTLQMGPRESFPAALLRAGLSAQEANQVAAALADDFDTVNPHPGLALYLSLKGAGATAGTRLATLELSPREDERLGLFREADGALQLRRLASPAFAAPSLTRGVVHGSLYLSLVEAGVAVDQAARLSGLFGRRLDLTRDVQSGDVFRLVFDQRADGGGRALAPASLLYAELATRAGRTRLYRYRREGAGQDDWVDGDSGRGAPALLRTPLDGARLTSGFGMRLHPLLGFTRMHEGLDFGAPVGAPVLAAGDGVVEEARWSGDYGRWLKIRHGADLETGYGHLSAWGPGVAPGVRVRQGQIVAFVGQSGLATGPHLHYEVFASGRRIDPAGARTSALFTRPADLDPDFRARRANIDAAVAALAAACAAPDLFSSVQTPRCVG